MKGYVQVYTGNGKGKTTAALGLALRATGAGKKVFIAQFIKGRTYSEITAINNYLPAVIIKQYGMGCFIVNKPCLEDIEAAKKGLEHVSEVIASGEYDLIVLDEACIAIYYELFTVEELIRAISRKKDKTEIVITGRYAPQKLLDFADLVTEMIEIKHYFKSGVEARKGIEY
ncbi:MAG: cob(I)yrinic acid a,c-diamide adenosyltransferase [Bacteroidales bacterium]|jgi:cob(I)alamin adenosyltransferase|nr:cob(I)yrinic acid a,c-diamide adenosyltransferase [Bacteroidales bacterium]MDD4257746.1 cob(I)yrinic acid a,c-diamide adenosyltransferase [Bacteroidales bacterium]MDD4500558.1 cob(I)yrinic acid a,c-diamide adenosyltransferase [Bacteroidales bacterium]MDD4827820.1 cob(I)yrinic acid a,c-diamide adenosyltransferase [Bacteroidales bacterium]